MTSLSSARELSRYKLKILVLEKGHDLCAGASKCNSGMIHAGYDPIPGTNEAKFNAQGCALMYRTHPAPPVRRGDILIRDICGTGCNVIATRDAMLK